MGLFMWVESQLVGVVVRFCLSAGDPGSCPVVISILAVDIVVDGDSMSDGVAREFAVVGIFGALVKLPLTLTTVKALPGHILL